MAIADWRRRITLRPVRHQQSGPIGNLNRQSQFAIANLQSNLQSTIYNLTLSFKGQSAIDNLNRQSTIQI
jgi:hypothetical protein